jgi:DNA-directed RNA polymerase specialized sigma24 family protein
MTEMILPHVQLERSDMARYETIMRRGNKILKKWALIHHGKKNKSRLFRTALFKGELRPSQIKNAAGKSMTSRDMKLINAVREIEEPILFSFVRSATKLAKRAYKSNYTFLDQDDLIQDALMIVRECIYSFSKDEATFHTYVHTSIRRGLRRKINEANDLSGFSEDDMLLLTSYRRAQEKAGASAPVEEVVSLMEDVNDDQIERLRDLTIRFVRSCEMYGGEDGNDTYQNLGVCDTMSILEETPSVSAMSRMVVDQLKKTVPSSKRCKKGSRIQTMFRKAGQKRQDKVQLVFNVMPEEVHDRFLEAIERADLQPLERDLIMAAHKGERRFQSRIASQHVNPKTGKPFTRMTACNALRDAMRMVMSLVEEASIAC